MLQGLGGLSLAAGANRMLFASVPGLPGRAALLDDAAQVRFPKPEIIRYDPQCFTIHGKDVFLYSACMHYPRTPKALWRDRLTKLKQAGFNTIETYVFWNYHEPVEGQVDMTEFTEFVKLAGEMGFWLITRVGPYACAEWDAGGFPHWLIEKQFPLRSDAPESIRSSQGWYDHVLPIVKENMITNGGPVILIQIENEYDFWDLPNAQKLAYVTALAKMVWKAGIDIPIITNWVKQARDNSDPVMAQIMDTCDFYPRWNFVKEVVPGLALLRKQEPMSPVSIAELQGGWFAQFGGQLSVDQEGVDAAQLNAIAKTVIENATTFFSFYMGHGGTNFDWAARDLTTTYDYAAPVREPGGLWSKYYAARLLGASLEKMGPMIVRAKESPGAATVDSKQMAASLRVNGQSGVLFLRNNEDSPAEYELQLTLPGGSSAVKVPQQGKLAIRRHGMKMLQVELPFAGGQIRYSTAEVLTHGSVGERKYLVVYDDPGMLVEIALQADNEPKVTGEVEYQNYDAASRTAVIGYRGEMAPKHLLLDGSLQIITLPSELAERTWTAGAGSEETPIITDCSLLRSAEAQGSGMKMTLEYAPGEHELTVLSAAAPGGCSIDGKTVPVAYDGALQTASVRLTTPALPFAPVVVEDGRFRVEQFDPAEGKWLHSAPMALEKLGQIPYGYVKYRGSFDWNGEEKLYMETFTKQMKRVFVNGVLVPELSRDGQAVSASLTGFAKQGKNLLEISYEAFGSANFGKEMAELTGISGIHLGSDQKKSAVAELEIQLVPAAMHGREVDPQYGAASSRQVKLGTVSGPGAFAPAYTWFTSEFSVPESGAWFCPWNVTIASERDALLYVNGRFVGNYKTIGPQEEFYVPETYLKTGEEKNVLTVVLAYAKDVSPLRTLTVSPFTEFAARRTEVVLS